MVHQRAGQHARRHSRHNPPRNRTQVVPHFEKQQHEGQWHRKNVQGIENEAGTVLRDPESGFRVQGSGFRVKGLGFRVKGLGLRV